MTAAPDPLVLHASQSRHEPREEIAHHRVDLVLYSLAASALLGEEAPYDPVARSRQVEPSGDRPEEPPCFGVRDVGRRKESERPAEIVMHWHGSSVACEVQHKGHGGGAILCR